MLLSDIDYTMCIDKYETVGPHRFGPHLVKEKVFAIIQKNLGIVGGEPLSGLHLPVWKSSPAVKTRAARPATM